MQRGDEFCTRTNIILTEIMEKTNTYKVETCSHQPVFFLMMHRYKLNSTWTGGHTHYVIFLVVLPCVKNKLLTFVMFSFRARLFDKEH